MSSKSEFYGYVHPALQKSHGSHVWTKPDGTEVALFCVDGSPDAYKEQDGYACVGPVEHWVRNEPGEEPEDIIEKKPSEYIKEEKMIPFEDYKVISITEVK